MARSGVKLKEAGEAGWIACDPMAMAVALDSSLVEESEERQCAVEVAQVKAHTLNPKNHTLNPKNQP